MSFQRAANLCLLLALLCDFARAGEPVTVTWMVGVGPDRPLYEELVRTFHEKQSKVRIKFFWVPGSQYQVKLKTLIAAGVAPDIFWSCDAWLPYELPFLADLTDYVKQDAAELDLDDFYPELLQACTYEGRYYLLPRWFNLSLLYYNKKLFDAAGESYPSADWTWDDFVRAAQKLQRVGPDGRVEIWGSQSAGGWWGEWMIYVRQSGGTLFSDDMNRCLLDTPEAIRGMQFYFDKIHKYRIAPRPGFGPEYGFISGKIAMEIGGHTANWVPMNQIPGLEWDIQVLPIGPARREGGEYAIDTFGISRFSPRIPAAWEFIKFLASKQSIRRHVQEGYLSVRKSVSDELLFRHKRTQQPYNIHAAYEQLKYAQVLPRSPDFVEIALDVIQPDIDRMIDKQLDVAATCRKAAAAANRFIAVLGATRRENHAAAE